MGEKSATEHVERKIGDGPFGVTEKEQLQKKAFVCTFAMLAKVASADGNIGKKEILAVDHFMKNVLQLDAARREFAISAFNESRRAPGSFEEYAEEYRNLLKDKPTMFEWMVDVLLQLSMADHLFSDSEEELIKKASRIFGLADEKYRQLRTKRLAERSEESYNLLGCSPQASLDEVNSRYAKLSRDYDPEKIKQLELPEDFVKLAVDRSRELEQAHSIIKRLKELSSG